MSTYFRWFILINYSTCCASLLLTTHKVQWWYLTNFPIHMFEWLSFLCDFFIKFHVKSHMSNIILINSSIGLGWFFIYKSSKSLNAKSDIICFLLWPPSGLSTLFITMALYIVPLWCIYIGMLIMWPGPL